MTGDINRRIGSYHTYLPAGLYYKCFLKSPSLLKGYLHRGKYLKNIEVDIYEYIKNNGGVPVKKFVEGKNTEWIFCSVSLVYEAFDYAYEKYGGKKYQFVIQ
jgi:hypothetical protein